MKKRMLGLLLVLALLAAALCTTVFAAGGAVYVSEIGSDTTGDGSQANPYATLAKAVEEAEDGSTIYVMSNLTMTECARFYDKSLTITSGDDGPYTITRSDSFETISDTARSWYNPAMIEVQTTSKGANLTLTNIILTDGDKHEGTIFAQANTIEDEANTKLVQDAMIASNATVDTTITLGDGAVLQNFGGMSAVRVTDQAKLVMKSGSVIEDTDSHTTRTRGTTGSVGPAGAVWIQGASFEMEAGATIQNVDGRAVYVDGGSATIGGTISGITANDKMWQGNSGTALHLRGEAKGTLTSGASITACTGTLIDVTGSTFTMDNGAVITENSGGNVIYSIGSNVTINGEIAYNNAGKQHVLQTANNTVTTIGTTGNIHHNTIYYGTVYLNGENESLDFYGKINYNRDESQRGGGIVLSNNGNKNKNAVMYEGAEVIGNYAKDTGGGMMISRGTFTMKGGTIKDNSTDKEGGGVYVRAGGHFIMEGGTISNNTAVTYGGGIALDTTKTKDYGPSCVTLISGTISGNTDSTGSNDLAVSSEYYGLEETSYLSIGRNVQLGNKSVRFLKDSKTITPTDTSFDIKLHNASGDANTALKDASTARGWSNPLATFWAQRDGAATLTVDVSGADAKLPVYALMLHTDSDGATYGDDQVVAATKNANGSFTFTIPADYKEAGCAVALVQPTEYYGDLVITADKATLLYDEAAETYTITYTETFTLSENLKSQLLDKELGVYMNNVKITLLPDLRLPMDVPMYTFESSIFECKTITGITGGGANSFTANCVLKEGWDAHLSEPTVLTVIAVLDKVDFEAGDMLATTGEVVINPESGIEFTPNGDAAVAAYAANINPPPEVAPFSNVYIPGNVCTTLMLAQEDEGGEDKPNQPTGGFFFPMGEEHMAYVSGYPDGTVRPEANITRAESAAMLYRLMSRGYFASGAQTPADVTTNDWYYSIVSQMVGSGYLTGYADGTFRGNNNVTRAEFVTMLVRLSGARGGWCSFTDVSSAHWAYGAISTAAAEGWIGGYADGSFRPDQAITRAEAMTIINRALDRGVDETSWLDDYIRWPDNPRDAWYYYEVIEATNDHCYTGSRPNEDWVG